MKTFGFIFARGGSKGLPKKNIKLLAGKPLLQYSIETALKSPSVDTIFVSTDCPEISKVAQENGATVIARPDELATDNSPEWLSWVHAISYVQENVGNFDNFVSLPATSPLRSSDDVEGAIEKLEGNQADICISITPANRSPYFNMVKVEPDDSLVLVEKLDSSISRRQDAPEVFDITTVIYAASVDFVLSNNSIFDGNVVGVVVPKERAVDIDDIYDFMLAEAILEKGS